MRILLTHDGSEMADVAVPTTRALAELIQPDVEITALCITSSQAGDGSPETAEAEASLDRIARVFAPQAVTRMVRRGNVGPLVIETAEELNADLIAMSTAGVSGRKRFLGSVADHVARGSHRTPVMLCRPMIAGTKHFAKILLPLDGSAINASAVAWAGDLALRTGAEVVLIRSIDNAEQLRSMTTPAGYRLNAELVADGAIDTVLATEAELATGDLEAVAAGLRASGVRQVSTDVTAGVPGETIVQAAKAQSCDVIVISPSGRGRGEGAKILGSVADHVLQHVGEAAVIIVPAPEDTAQQ